MPLRELNMYFLAVKPVGGSLEGKTLRSRLEGHWFRSLDWRSVPVC